MKKRLADTGIDELRKVVDTIITIPNDQLFKLSSKNSRIKDVFAMANEVLGFAVRGISDLIMVPGFVNLDFADVRTIMRERGMALMGTGISGGADRASEAARSHFSPLLRHLHPGRPGDLSTSLFSGYSMEELKKFRLSRRRRRSHITGPGYDEAWWKRSGYGHRTGLGRPGSRKLSGPRLPARPIWTT
jgi:cell division protein FtsZ